MKRVYAAIATAVILLGLLPSAVSADRVSKCTDHYVFAGCDAPFDGGFVSTFFELGSGGGSIRRPECLARPGRALRVRSDGLGIDEAFDLGDDGTTIDVASLLPDVRYRRKSRKGMPI